MMVESRINEVCEKSIPTFRRMKTDVESHYHYFVDSKA